MAMDLKDFDAALLQSAGELPDRVLALLQRSSQAHTAREISADLQGVQERYMRVLSPEIERVLPLVTQVLEDLANQGKIRTLDREEPTGKVTYYGKGKGVA